MDSFKKQKMKGNRHKNNYCLQIQLITKSKNMIFLF